MLPFNCAVKSVKLKDVNVTVNKNFFSECYYEVHNSVVVLYCLSIMYCIFLRFLPMWRINFFITTRLLKHNELRRVTRLTRMRTQ